MVDQNSPILDRLAKASTDCDNLGKHSWQQCFDDAIAEIKWLTVRVEALEEIIEPSVPEASIN